LAGRLTDKSLYQSAGKQTCWFSVWPVNQAAGLFMGRLTVPLNGFLTGTPYNRPVCRFVMLSVIRFAILSACRQASRLMGG
jgi:hypothetical protein